MCHTDQVVEGNDVGFILLTESDKTFVHTFHAISSIATIHSCLPYSTYLFMDFHLCSMTKLNKTIRDEGITVDFWFIKVHTSN